MVNSMQCAVEKFVNAKQNGLCLIDMPTGSGKTYLTGKIIGAFIRGEILQDVERIFYLTPQKKNIDDIYNDIKRDFSDALPLFDANVLRIYANYESVLDKFLDVYDQIPCTIKNRQSCKDLKKQIELYKGLSTSSNIPKDVMENIVSEIRRRYEIAFRKDLSEELSKVAKKKRDKKVKINSKEYSWIKDIYPACLTDDRKVLFMTVDKFISGNDPIISKPYRFISHSKTKNALIFIDEFDATKDVLLNQEIQNCTDYKMDLIKLFSSISNTLKGREFPVSIFANSLDENDKTSSVYHFNKMKKYFLEAEKKYNLNYLFKLDSQEDTDRYFLFDDYQLHTVTNTNSDKNVILSVNKNKRQNTISISQDSDEGRFYRTIYSIKNAINVFINCCAKMAQIYMNRYNDEARKNHSDMMEIDQAVSTIIDLYNLDYILAKNISAMIVDNIAIPVIDRGKDVFDTDFYMNGFRYYDFKDDISHNESTTMMMCYLDNTPEKFMLSLASKARVVGLSATATIETVTGNYSIQYLKDRLIEDYYELPEEDKENIKKYIRSRLNISDNISAAKASIDEAEEDELEKIIAQLFNTQENIELYAGKLEKYKQADRYPYYHIKRLVKAMKAVRAFVSNKNSKVLLVMTNRSIVENSEYNILSKEIIDSIIDSLSVEAGVDRPKTHYLSSVEFLNQKESYKKDIQAGEKVILFSSYNTAGTGQNLQYEIDEKEVDIDSIYLELPTNILVNISELREETSLIKLIYQYEALKTSGEITRNSAFNNIKAAFRQFMSERPNTSFDYYAYGSDSINNHIIKILIQAVGRICRTKNKNENINIYVDEEIYKRIDFSVAYKNGRILNPEFKKIAELNIKKKQNDTHNNLNRACDRNARVKTRIVNMLNVNRTSWNESDVLQWVYMRDFVLKHPTISREELALEVKKHYSIKDFYLEAKEGIKINHYLYVDDEQESKQIFYDSSQEIRENAISIDEYGTRLTNLIRIPAVRKAFKVNRYATTFEKNDCMILPVVYQNIYKGALGEVAGRAILEEYGISLEEITDATKFEKFDFCLADNNDVYIDFKNWSESDKVDRDEYRKKCLTKLDKIQGKKVFIINVAADSFVIHRSCGGRVVEISSLCKRAPGSDLLYQLDAKDKNKVVNLLLEACGNGNL